MGGGSGAATLEVEPTPGLSPPIGGHEAPTTRRAFDVLGLGWVVAAAIAVLMPALLHGSALGPYKLLLNHGLGHQSRGVARTITDTSDQISQLIPWTALGWTQVHQGHLPLWNPYSALGMPLAFNWNSATFSLPALVGYLFPLRLAYTSQILTTLMVAGTGGYLFARLVKMGALAATLVGTAFELSGALMAFMGWPIASVLSWTGWLFAGVILIVGQRHRARNVAFFALVLALSIYAGQPDALVLLLLSAVVFSVALLATRIPVLGGSGPILRPFIDLIVASVAGFVLAAPLALPGYQVISRSIISVERGAYGLHSAYPLSRLGELAFPGLDGHRITGEAAYLSVIVVVLAVTSVGLRLRRPEVAALVAVAVTLGVIGFVDPVADALNAIPHLQSVKWARAAVPTVFAVVALGGLGLDLLLRRFRHRALTIWLGAGYLLSVVALLIFVVVGSPSAARAGRRNEALIWAAIETAVGLAGVGLLLLARRRERTGRGPGSRRAATYIAASWLVCTTSFLIAAGGPLWSSSSGLSADPAETTLQHSVGTSLVGFGVANANLGIWRDVNDMFGVHELAVIDGSVPRSYFTSWGLVTGKPDDTAGFKGAFSYSPAINSARAARVYGVGYVLEARGSPGPRGGVFDKTIGDEDLYRIPNSGPATLTPLSGHGVLPSIHAMGTVVPVTYPSPSSWKITTDASTAQVLRLRLNNTPGWQATIDGQPLRLSTFADVMLQARIPPGRHTIELHYWPDSFTVGIVLALIAAVLLVVAVVVGELRSRRGRGRGPTTMPPVAH